MDNIMKINGTDISREILERTNPVFNTAKMTLFQLSAAGDKNAAAIAKKLGLTLEGTQASSSGVTSPEEMILGSIIMETRYHTMGKIAESLGYDTEVDLPCGYTPRAIEFANKGKHFVGLDLPAAVQEAEPVITSLIDEDKRSLVRFAGVDATNYQSLKEVFDDIEGEICITTEGLLMYFTDSEAGILCGNIKKLLDQHGGCWITADTETAVQYVLTAQAFFGDRFMEYMMKGKERSEDKSDIKMGQMSMIVSPSGDTAENMRRAMMFLAYHGLKAERLIVADYAPELKSLEKATPEQAEKIREAMTKFAYWKITSVKTETLDTTDTQADNFKAEASLNGDMLSIALHGRLDTLSAPKLLTFFENTAEEHRIGEVSIDCKELDYISSAGLRVLMIMQKNSENGVYLRAINGSVREILEQTGFDSILNIVR